MAGITVVAVVIIFGIAGFALILGIIVYRKRIFKRKAPPIVKRKAAFSLGGNFVEDLTVPIETKYEVTKNVLGSGSSAQVVIGENRKSKRKYAIKVIDLSRHEVAWRYEREKNFLKDIDHTNVVRLYEVYSSPAALYFVMELCTGGHLGQVLRSSPEGRLDEDVAMEYILQLTRAIGHCHHHGICHRDVKLQNILLESSSKEAQIKLVDFGNGARFRNQLPLTKVVGTTYTAAPEVFKERYDERCDVWSLGVVTYILLSGRRPFEKMEVPCSKNPSKKEESVVASILLGKYNFNHEVWDEVSNDAINFIKHCFVLDYTKRSSAAAMLEHPWLADTDETFDPSENNIRKLSFNSSDTLRKTLGRELSSPFSGIRHISMLAVAFARPTDKVQMLRKVFQEIDYNGSGMIERDEFMAAMKHMNPDLSSAQTNALFQRMDQDENHCISFIEFLAAALDPKDVDLNEMKQAFRLIDRENKGFISRDDVWRILNTTNVQDLEEVGHQQVAAAAGSAGHGAAAGGSTATGTVGSTTSTAAAGTSSAGTAATAGGATVGFASLISSRRSSREVEGGSGRTAGSAEEANDVRVRKLEQRIDEIMLQADVNSDGVISYNEFIFAMSGGDLTHYLITGEGGSAAFQDLADAPAIMHHKTFSEVSFVSSLKKKLSEGNMLFSRDLVGGKSFPSVRKKPAGNELHSMSWFRFPFGRVATKTSAQSRGAAIYPAASSDNDSVASHGTNAGASAGACGSGGLKEVSLVSYFDDHEKHERRPSGSDDIESQSMKRFSSPSQRVSFSHMSLSHSSKGPSWIEKPTPNSSFHVGGILAGAATAGLLPSFVWQGKKPPRQQQDTDIAAVIAKLEHQKAEKSRLSDLRMNHDDPGLLVERAKSPPGVNAGSAAKPVPVAPNAALAGPAAAHVPSRVPADSDEEELGVLRDIESAEFSAELDALDSDGAGHDTVGQDRSLRDPSINKSRSM